MTDPLILSSDDDEGALLAVPFDDTDAASSVGQKLSSGGTTPQPQTEEGPGPVRRASERLSSAPLSLIRRIILSGGESASAIRTRRDELYRNEFPRIEPRYAVQCDECGTEFDSEREECTVCESTNLSPPDPAEKRRARRLFQSVNPAGQSLRDVAKRAEMDQWAPPGVSTLVVEHEYYQATTGGLYREGEIYKREPTALYRADPLSLRPVVDEEGQPGNHWYVCPIHRDNHTEHAGTCHCGAERQPVHFVEGSAGGDYSYYLRHEVITWSYAYPRLRGLDGIAPSIHVWLKQAILQMMNQYAGAFYDTDSDRLPNQFMILHTPNPDHWEDELAKARDGDDPYASPIFTNQYSPQDSSTPEVDVIDAMPDELLGQSEDIKETFKKDIRRAYGISNIHDNDLSDAGGLNNEGLQLEVMDRSLASQMHDYREGWLDTLMKRLGFEGWRISFLPERGQDADELRSRLKAAAFVQQAGGQAEIVDGRLEVDDFEVDLDESDDPPTMQGAPNLPGVGSPVPEGGDGGGGGPASGGGPAALQAEVQALEQAAFSLLGVSDAVSQKGTPVYQNRDDVPPNVQNRIQTAVREHDFAPVDSASSATLQDVFETRLTQPQGWSLDSLTRHLKRETGLEEDDARTIARTEATAILNRAREDASAELAKELDETVLHYWDGPQDESTSVLCAWLKGGDSLAREVSDAPGDLPMTDFEGTHPEYGGTPVPMDELRDLEGRALDLFTDDGQFTSEARDHVMHANCRHTHRAILEREVN
jgi:hypothetical protein